jgi:putative peptidoglycan lipid II flippase
MNLLRALATVGGMTFVSRILGFVRDTLIARVFGAGLMTDAFFVAFKIPNLLRRLFAEGAFSQAFVPVLSEYKNKRSLDETHALINHVGSLLLVALLGVTVIGVIAAPVIVAISAPNYVNQPDKFGITVDLLRVTFPYIFFISMASLAGAVLNSYQRFFVQAFTPVWLNVAFILAALFFAPYFNPPIMVLAWAVFVGGVLQLAYQIPYLLKIGFIPRFRWNLQDDGARRILRLMAPAIFGVSIAQISLLINTIFATFLVTGSVSWLYYADRLMEFPTGILGVALGTILLPSLSKTVADKDTTEYSKLMDWGLRLTFVLAAPAAVALAVLSAPLVICLFQYGAFKAHDVLMTQQALMAYSFGLLGLILVKVLAPGFYARQNIKTPVKIAIITLVTTQLMNLFFVFGLEMKHAGLALSIGLGACLNAVLLYVQLRKNQIFVPNAGWLNFTFKLIVALVFMGSVLYWLAGTTQDWMAYELFERLIRMAGLVAVGAAVYFVCLYSFGFRLADFKYKASA